MSETDLSVDENNNEKKNKEVVVDQKVKKVEDNSHFITEDEFVAINFDLEWPKIICDLAEYLTGTKNVLKSSKISEKDELPTGRGSADVPE